jgi:recombination protein RecA
MFKEAREEYETKTGKVWDVPMFIGLDSIAGIPPKAEYEAASYENEQALGLHARRLSKFFRKVSGLISKEQICLVCTNQLKTDTGVRYGNKDTEIGGKALKFHASLRLDLRRTGFIEGSVKGGEPIGIISTAKTVKNKVMVPFKSVEIPIVFGEGISYHLSLFNALMKKKIIKRTGNTYTLLYRVNKEKQTLQATFEKKFLNDFKEITKSKVVRRNLERKLDKE